MSISTTSFNPSPYYVTRFVKRGVSARPQGADGIDELTRTAYAELVGAQWEAEDEAPTLPVHEFDRKAPAGDAFRATWGYDGTARTEQSNCGAVCYTVALPAGGGMTGVLCRVVGDRYLGDGARVSVVVDSSPTPPAWNTILASAYTSDVLCATDSQAETPNNREGVSVDCSIDAALTVSSGTFVHIVLRIDNYLTHRKSWVEGGAMIAQDSIRILFSDSSPLVYNRRGTRLIAGYDDALYEDTGNSAEAIGSISLRTPDCFVYFPLAASDWGRETLNLFKKGDLFIDQQQASLKTGSTTTMNVGTDIIHSIDKYFKDFSISRSDGYAQIGRLNYGGAGNYMFTGWLAAMSPDYGGTFNSLLAPVMTGDMTWTEPKYEFEMVVYKAKGLPPFVPVNDKHSKNNLVCACFDPFHFPFRTFFEEKTAKKIYFSNTVVTSVVPESGIPNEDEAAALAVEFVEAWTMHGSPSDVPYQDISGAGNSTAEGVTEFRFSKPLTISAKEVLIVGYWPKRYVGGSGNEYILSPKGWEFALLQ